MSDPQKPSPKPSNRKATAAEQARKGRPFFVFIILIGLGVMTPFVLQAVRDYRIARVYQPTHCQVLDERTVSSSSRSQLGGTWYNNETAHTEFSWAYVVNATRYVAEGYDNHDGIMAGHQEMSGIHKGVHMPCWYDPADPEKSVLVRRFRAEFYLGALIPGFFILLGGWFLRSSLRRRPDYADVRVSQGARLPVRLSPIVSTRGVAGCLSIVIVVVALFLFVVLPRISFGDVAPSLLGGLWPYLIVGGIEAFLIYHWLRAMRAARVADPVIEIGAHPLSPGQQTQVYFSQPGPVHLATLKVVVLCERTDGKGTRTSHEKALLTRENLEVVIAEDFTGELVVPARAAASLKTLQSVVSWMVRVRRVLKNGTRYETDYPFTVLAAGEDGSDEPA
ncbi:MAG: DUF3592 domain-containing protein [Comamonadaceae bacterium]|nr:DUF3592 domain-containing protein [Comamonadaceae bacterium]